MSFAASLIGSSRAKPKIEIKKKKLNPVYILIPTVFDILETICSNIALTLLVASVTQMLRATLILFTAMLSVLILKMKLQKHHY